MWIVLWIAAPLYSLVAFVFFTLSATELQEAGKFRASSIGFAALAAAIWPLTLVVMSFLIAGKMPFQQIRQRLQSRIAPKGIDQ